MTEQTKRALERLPKGPLKQDRNIESVFLTADGGVTYAHFPNTPRGSALAELAARSPKLLEMLDEVLVIASAWEMRGSNWSSKEAAANSTALAEARAFLRETTRGMLNQQSAE